MQPTSAQEAAEADVEIGSAYIGTVLDGRYLIQEIIGHGGMGTVFRAEQILMKKSVAIKLLHAELAARKQVVGRFTREARAISRLSSPHTVRVFDFGRWNDLFFLVMELLDGDTLDVLLAQAGPLPHPRVARIVLQMCDSLGEAHEAGIVHRDLKPENIVLSHPEPQTDFVKILDFGLAKIKDNEDLYTVHSKRDLFGTPYYMSPEQIKAGEVDGRSDIYSVGALMFRMLTGQLLHGGEQATFDILKAHLTQKTPRLADVAPKGTEIPAALERIVAKCLAKEPAARFQTMAELAAAIRTAEQTNWQAPALPQEDEDDQRAETVLRLTQRRRVVMLAVLALVLMAGVTVALWWQAAPSVGQELEPNDDPRHPQVLGVDGAVTGVLGKRRSQHQADQDCFALPKLPAGQVLTVEVTGLPNMDLQLALHDKDGDARLTVDHRGRGQGELLRLPDPGLPVTAVCVTEAVAENGVASESLSDHYQLQVQAMALPEGAEHEPNDQPPGEPLAIDAPRSGSLDGPRDRDVFRLEGAADGRLMWIALDLQDNPPPGVRFALYDQAGRMVASRALAPAEKHAKLGFVPAGDQIPDRLVIFRQALKDTPLSPDEVTYRVTFTQRDLIPLIEEEPNETPEQATPLALGSWTLGNAADGQDWLRLEGGDASFARVRLEVQATGTGAVQLTVRDVGQQVDVRTLTVLPGQPQDLVLLGGTTTDARENGLLIKLTPHGKGEAKWSVRARYLAGVLSGK